MSVRPGDSVAPQSTPVEAPSLVRRVLRPRTILSFAVGIIILVFALGQLHINVGETLGVIRGADWRLYVAAILVYYATFPIRGFRWQGMLVNAGCALRELPSFLGLGEIIYLSWFANSVVPAKLGDVYRGYLLRERSTVTFPKAVGTIVAERLVDLAVVLVLLGASGLLSLQGRLPSTVLTVLKAGSLAVVVAGIGLLMLRRLDPLVRRLVPARFQGIYAHFHEGTLGSFGGYPRLLGLTAGAWVLEAGRLFLVTRALGVTLSPNPVEAALMVVFIALAGALLTAPPGTPGGLGYVEATMVFALTLFGLGQSTALSVALLDRSISFGSVVVFGFVVYLFSQRHATN